MGRGRGKEYWGCDFLKEWNDCILAVGDRGEMTLNLSKGIMKSHYFPVGSPGLLLLVGFNVAFNNFSVLSQRCLVATGSSMLIPGHIILINILTLGRPVLALPDIKVGAASTIFNNFGILRPGIEPETSHLPERTLCRQSYLGQLMSSVSSVQPWLQTGA